MNKDLNEKQKKAIYLMLHKHYSKTEAAQELGISQSTIYSWLRKNKAFADAYREEEDLIRVARIKEDKIKAEKAVEKLFELLNCGNERIELAAAKELIDVAENKIFKDECSANDFNLNIVVESGEPK